MCIYEKYVFVHVYIQPIASTVYNMYISGLPQLDNVLKSSSLEKTYSSSFMSGTL